MWLTEGCGGRRRAVATPNRESRKEKKTCRRGFNEKGTCFASSVSCAEL